MLAKILAGLMAVTVILAWRAVMTKLDEIQAAQQQIKDAVAAVGGSLTNIAADIDRIAGTVGGGLTEAQAADVVAGLTGIRDSLQGLATQAAEIAAKNPEPEQGPGGTVQ